MAAEEEGEIFGGERVGLGKRRVDGIREGTAEIERGERKRTKVSAGKRRGVYGER